MAARRGPPRVVVLMVVVLMVVVLMVVVPVARRSGTGGSRVVRTRH